MMTVQIKPATPTDAAQLTVLGRQTFVEAFEKDNNPQDFWAYVDEAFQEATIQQELDESHSAFFIAYAENEAVGYLKLRFDHTPTQLEGKKALEIQRIYVQQSAIGKGIGAQLLQVALRYAQANAYTTAWLGVWEHNARAIRFYQKWSFQIFGSHRFMMGDDPQTDLLMKRDIPVLDIEPASSQDLPGITTLLQEQKLPTEDLSEQISLLVVKDMMEQQLLTLMETGGSAEAALREEKKMRAEAEAKLATMESQYESAVFALNERDNCHDKAG